MLPGEKFRTRLPGSDFEVPLDTLILAISQHAVLDFFDGEPISLNKWGYIDADPLTFETSLPGVFAGGDVVNDGPSSIVEAAADGKAIAQSILQQHRNGSGPREVAAFDTSRPVASPQSARMAGSGTALAAGGAEKF